MDLPATATSTQGAASLLRQRLAPQSWPLAIEQLPPGCALVGGAVRDGLLDRLPPHPDLDLVVPTGAIALARQLAKAHRGVAVVLDAPRDMARVVLGPWTIDLAACAGSSLVEDLHRRDYRINAMALPLGVDGPLLDPLGGLADLAKGQLTAISEANLQEDPLRLLRGPRLAAELNFQLAASTSAFVQRHGALLSQVSAERVLAELEKLARCPLGAQGLRQAIELGLLQPWLEELALDNLQPLNDAGPLSAAEATTALPLARFAQLFGASGLGRLRASKRLQQRCSILRKWLRILATSPSLGEEQQLLLCQELELDLAALVLLAPQQTKGWLERWRNPNDCLFHPRSPIDGVQLQRELGIKPGPALGLLLAQLTRARAFGRPHNLEAARILAEQRPPAA